MIKFKYIIGANIELTVSAKIIPNDPEVNYEGGVEILSVSLVDGLDVETEDIYISSNRNGPEKLDDLLEIAALENWSNQK